MELSVPSSSTCSANRGLALQVTKAFLDLDDANNEQGTGVATGDDDTTSQTTNWVLDGWAAFASGTADRQKNESTADGHGPNMWDYSFNRGMPTAQQESSIRHNCLQTQKL